MKALLILLLTVVTASAETVMDRLGLQMYSLRVEAKAAGMPAALDKAKKLGFRAIEAGAPFAGQSLEQSKKELESRDLSLIALGVGYERLQQDLAAVVADATKLGVQFVEVTWIPHKEPGFTEAEARAAIADFNRWGEAFHAAKITFAYHPHGYEFSPLPSGETLFDLIVRETKPGFVSFEMDVFWVTHGGQDAAKLLAKYPDRWKLMHVKDIRKGAPTGIYTGHAPESDDVPVGTGQIDWPTVLKTAQQVGVQWYFIEDESAKPEESIPQSVTYLRSLGL